MSPAFKQFILDNPSQQFIDRLQRNYKAALRAGNRQQQAYYQTLLRYLGK